MNYYIINTEVFNTIEKNNVDFRLFSLDKTKVLVSTTDTINNTIEEFANSAEASSYTQINHVDWAGNGYGIPEWEIQEMTYIPEIDD